MKTMKNDYRVLILYSKSPDNSKLLSKLNSLFKTQGVLKTTNVENAFMLVQKQTFDFIFIEHNPNSPINSIEFTQYVREILHYSTPIVIFTNYGSEEIAIKAMLSGANDYFVTETIDYNEFENRLSAVILLHNVAQKTKTDLKKYKELCLFDELTNLYNRHGLKKYLSKELSYAIRHNVPLTCFYLDLDEFKIVNDKQGHSIGDLILIEAAKRLLLCMRNEDIVSRYGGDEFIIICIGLSDRIKIMSLASKIINSIKKPYKTPNGKLYINISIGISTSNKNSTFLSLINNADQALKTSKETKGVFTFYKGLTE